MLEVLELHLGKKEKKQKTVTQTFTNCTFFFLFAYSLPNRIFALKGPHGIVEEM